MPNLLKYFDAQIIDKVECERDLIKLLCDYLMNHKDLITLDSSYLRENMESEKAVEFEFYEATIQSKNLAQFVRCLAAKKNDGKFQIC